MLYERKHEWNLFPGDFVTFSTSMIHPKAEEFNEQAEAAYKVVGVSKNRHEGKHESNAMVEDFVSFFLWQRAHPNGRSRRVREKNGQSWYE